MMSERTDGESVRRTLGTDTDAIGDVVQRYVPLNDGSCAAGPGQLKALRTSVNAVL